MPDTMAGPSGASASGAADGMLDALVIGAGFAGLYQLHLLRDRLGLQVQVLEAASGVGGTWFWNRYPGARCDSESYTYSFSFSEALQQEWEWTERYPEQPEILRYLNHVADRFDLRRSIRLDTTVSEAAFDEAGGCWEVRTEAGERLRARFLVTAVGCLSSANLPDIPGLEDFAGRWYHTGHWPHERVDVRGLRVGLVGTGSTGIQATPVLAAEAAQLTVFQRTANFSVPARNAPVDPDFMARVKADYAAVRAHMRTTPGGHPFSAADRSALEVSEEERQALYEAAWQTGGLSFRSTFRDILLDQAANDTAAAFIAAKIRAVVKDPATAAILTAFDHPYAAKRPPIDTGYFEAFNRDTVALVDLRAEPIERVTAAGLRTSRAEYPLDVLVFATGFDAMTGPLLRLNLRGLGGRTLREAWADGPTSYLGLQVAGFPNLFTITGPGSPSVLCNMPVAIEQHVEWVTDCIAHLRTHGLSRIEATPEAAERWGTAVNEAAARTLLPLASSSWYLGANVPGKPRAFMPYAGGLAHYRGLCEQVVAQDYEGFALGR